MKKLSKKIFIHVLPLIQNIFQPSIQIYTRGSFWFTAGKLKREYILPFIISHGTIYYKGPPS